MIFVSDHGRGTGGCCEKHDEQEAKCLPPCCRLHDVAPGPPPGLGSQSHTHRPASMHAFNRRRKIQAERRKPWLCLARR
jgi:hypothetical protein